MAFEPIETQEALDEVIKDRLKRERDKVKAEYADYDDLFWSSDKLTGSQTNSFR